MILRKKKRHKGSGGDAALVSQAGKTRAYAGSRSVRPSKDLERVREDDRGGKYEEEDVKSVGARAPVGARLEEKNREERPSES